MIRRYSYAVDDSVLEFFSASKKREREQLMRVFALSPTIRFKREILLKNPGREANCKSSGLGMDDHVLARRSRDRTADSGHRQS
jgi:hypothetical protein